ncbi:MAG: hypothetical protein PHS73_05275, partial [Candidatus Peribacteraceae bacterium]|nr:hypothetical protein [Candidatus Peribacteraceae bacterium]
MSLRTFITAAFCLFVLVVSHELGNAIPMIQGHFSPYVGTALAQHIEGEENDETDGSPGGGKALPQQWGGVTLLQPLGGLKAIQVSSGFGTFLTYFNQATEWLLIVVVGICVIWVLLGGFQIMLSGGFSGMDSAGKTHMIWAIAGLAITLFAG